MGSNEHIVMLPFMAHGHLIPFLALARKIHQTTGFTITIANTPLNIQYLRNTINSTNNSEDSKIRLAELPFIHSDFDLPPNAENTEFLPPHEVINLCQASVSLEAPLYGLISNIIKDEGWAVNVAKSVGSVNVTFTTCGAYGTAAIVSLWQHLPHQTTESHEFLLPGFPPTLRFVRSQLSKFLRVADGSDSWSSFLRSQISLSLTSCGWLCNTVEEVESLGLEILRNYTELPIWTIGPLLPPSMLNNNHSSTSFSSQHAGKELGIFPERCLEWLDSYPQGSVLYISFGSQNTISASQMMELAIGLEDSGKAFIWVIRPPSGFDIKGEFRAEWLPEGFEERISTSKRGLLVHGWAPQLEILSHKSTGVFLSHCGWNSVMESLSQGVPIIGWPLGAEQAINSKMLMEEMGVSVELTRGVQSEIVGKEVKRVIELVMDKKGKGEEMKKKAAHIGEQIRSAVREERGEKGSSLKAMVNFVAYILSKRQE